MGLTQGDATPAAGTRRGVDVGGSKTRVVRLLTASLALAGLSWLVWFVAPAAVAPGPLWWSALLALNVAITLASPNSKRRIVCPLQRWVVNPPVRLLLALGVVPLGWALIETTGRKTGKARRTPVGNGLVGNTFWIVAEHGRDAGYERNLARNPRVRIKARRGIRTVWTAGTAEVLDDDDPYARQRTLARWHPLRALNAAIVRVMGTDLLTIRIDLDT